MLTLRTLILFLAALVLAPGLGHAAVRTVTISGSVQFFDVPIGFSLTDPEPVSGGETYTITFDVDDATPLSSSQPPDVSVYEGAVSSFSFVIDGLYATTATSEGVLAAINTGNHQWSVFLGDDALDFSTSLPMEIVGVEDLSGEDEFFNFIEVNVGFFDFDELAYSQSPPELLAPSPATFDFQDVTIRWQSFSSGEELTAFLDVSSVTLSPVESPTVPSMGAPGLAPLALLLVGLARARAAG